MNFFMVDAERGGFVDQECEDLRSAMIVMGLKDVDHGIVEKGIAIVVYEHGLFESENCSWFSLNGRLYAGNAVFYGFDEMGETVELETSQRVRIASNIRFLFHFTDVERAIEAGYVKRPEIKINGAVIWRWPDKAPAGMGR